MRVKQYLKNTSGQFAIMFSVISALLMIGMVVAMDYSNMVRARAKIMAIADAAALAGATAADLSETERRKVVQDFIDANGASFLPATLDGLPDIAFDDVNEEVRVRINTQIPMFMGRAIGRKKAAVAGGSTASYIEKNVDPITIAFALDVSGSMGNLTSDNRIKIDALKVSITDLFTEIESSIDEPGLLDTALRTGMTTYNTAMVAQENMDWGWRHLGLSVDAMTAGGGTNSVPALSNAYQQILDDRAFRKINDPDLNIATIRESVVFMTDGDNNQPVWDDESLQICLNMREDGIEIYSVAFAAPDKGTVMLLDCASWDNQTKDQASKRPNGNSDNMGCLRSNTNAQNNNGQGPCKDTQGKEGHFFDADDAAAFRQAFKDIGSAILNQDIRIKT